MARFKLQFIRKFHLAFAALMLVTLAIAWYYNDSVNWHSYDIQRITLTNDILRGYQELSIQVFRELNTLSESVLQGDSIYLSEREQGVSALLEALAVVHQNIAEAAAFDGGGDVGEVLGVVAEIERLVEELIRTGEVTEQALKEGRAGAARDELAKLKNSGFADYFNILIDAAMADQRAYARRLEREADGFTHYVSRFLPVFMTALVITTLFFIFVLSRHLTRSVTELHQGATAFRDGDLSYQIPELTEKEFQRLGEAFNTMAIQLSEHRKQLRETNIQLETTVDERTRELQDSNRKLAIADTNRRRLLANISHEFRTPLTVIRGEAEIALRGPGKTNADYQESFQRIVDQSDNATRLVDDLLFIARADAGEPRLKLSSVVIAGMIDSVCTEFSAKAENKGIKIKKGRLAAGAVVQGDPGRLRQVFAILMENALRYSNPGDQVDVKVSQGDGVVEILFQDEGIGLTEEESELVFERFYRAPRAVEQAPGTGLGLPVAKAIVEAHNGTIILRGKPDQGAIAIVTLPIGREFGIVT